MDTNREAVEGDPMRVVIRDLVVSRDAPSGRNLVLDGVDLTIENGSVHAIIGPNGCGKTTLLRTIAGLEKPDRGRIDFEGESRRENRTALIFQDPTLLPWWDVARNIAIGSEFTKKPRAVYKRIREFHTAQVGLAAFGNRRPHELSRGMQTKAGMGRAFAQDSDVLLLDEPFVHLDVTSRRKIQEEMETHWQLDPRTHILVTHDVEEAILLSDRVSIMTHGPGRIADTIDIDLPRPRNADVRSRPGYLSAVSRIWETLDQLR
jgi:NitT/TauT family transport system ATP-binding protein